MKEGIADEKGVERMSSKNKKILLIAIPLLLVVTTAALVYSFYHAPPSPPLEVGVNASEIAPDELISMKKIVVSSGVNALQRVKQSHTGSIEHVRDVAIVHYMKEGKYLTLWTTLYPNETIAKNETEKMVEGMRKWGGSWASNLKEVTIANKQVYQTSSDSVPHYFWTDKEWVFYIIPHNFTEDEVAEIINAIPGEDTF